MPKNTPKTKIVQKGRRVPEHKEKVIPDKKKKEISAPRSKQTPYD